MMKIEEECQRLIFRLLRKQLIGQKSGSDSPGAGKVLYHWYAGKKKIAPHNTFSQQYRGIFYVA